MNFVGSLIRLPCAHGSARPPTKAGRFIRRCRTCHHEWCLIVEPAEHLGQKLGREVLHARWDGKKEDAA